MFTIQVTKEEVSKDYPQVVENWMNFLEKSGKEINEDKLEFYYSYGFFIPKVEDKQKFYEEVFENCSNMIYDERLVYELSKVRVNMGMKMGQFIISDRMSKEYVPSIIAEIVNEVTKVKMLVESEYHENQEVKDSIPELDSDIVSFDIIKDVVSGDYSDVQNFDIDSILDKISQKGMDSLSEEEKDFLNKKSKDI
jgi:hypothetical protein